VIAKLMKDIDGVTFFVVGIDTAVNEGLLARMADSTGGMVEMVESEHRLDEVMDRIQRRLATPLVSGLTLHSAGLDVISDSLVPRKLPNLMPGVPVVVRGRYRGRPGGGVRIEGRGDSGDVWQQHVEAMPGSNGCQGNLWARGKLQHLEDLYAIDDRAEERTSMERRIVELSTGFGVLCRFTALVAIDPRQPDRKAAPGSLRRIVQPVESAWPAAHAGGTPNSVVLCCPSQALAPDRDYFAFEDGDGSEATTTLDAARAEAVRILRKARPWLGNVGSLTTRRVKSLLVAVRRLLDSLVAAAAPRPTIESLSAAYERLSAMPADRDALVAMLDTLAEIGALPVTADHWWRASAADRG
jgi:Ca-activated chloride channel family protein